MEDEETADEMFEELGDEKTFTEVDKESNIFEELKKKIREAKTEEKMLEALKETIELTIKTVDRMTEYIAKQSIRIKELEEENYIPKQKVKNVIKKHKIAKEGFEKEYNSKHYKDDNVRARDFYIIVTEDRIIQALEKLLEDK